MKYGYAYPRRPHGEDTSPKDIVLSSNEVEEAAPNGTVVGTLFTVGGIAPFIYTKTGGAAFEIVGDELRVASSLTGITSQDITILSTDKLNRIVQRTFTITVVATIDNGSGIDDDDGTSVDDGGFETIIVEDSSGGLKITGKNKGVAKFVYDIGVPTKGMIVTMRYSADWSQLPKKGVGAMIGFGLKRGQDYHFVGLKGDGATPTTMRQGSLYGTDFGNRTTGTFDDGGAAAFGSKDGPNWVRLIVAADGVTFTLQLSPDGTSWTTVLADKLPTPLANVTDGDVFGIGVYLPGNDTGVFSVIAEIWVVSQLTSDVTLSSMHKSIVLSPPRQGVILSSLRKSAVLSPPRQGLIASSVRKGVVIRELV